MIFTGADLIMYVLLRMKTILLILGFGSEGLRQNKNLLILAYLKSGSSYLS